jgi:hypothetical protein
MALHVESKSLLHLYPIRPKGCARSRISDEEREKKETSKS